MGSGLGQNKASQSVAGEIGVCGVTRRNERESGFAFHGVPDVVVFLGPVVFALNDVAVQ